ncbi:MAG: MarC family protein [Methanophagales archaeon]|nr:MarC family protein [Methanophagales archaeon]MCW3139668.1 MarC family protein [Methanophagales archaeon]MCW7069040.1 MarC family protein [Methanophagales archaeon]MCW7072402.1 MarC family protein [Methanophagales archaeon]
MIEIEIDMCLELVKAFITLFVVMDPPGNVPIFIAVTRVMGREARKRELNHAVVVATLLLLLFAFLGKFVLDVLNISLDSFMVAGGILLLLVSFDLLREHKYLMKEAGRGIGAVPIGTPLLAGPGAITTVMVIIQSRGPFVALFAIFSAIIATKLILGQSERIYKVMGSEGSEVLSRVMGILVAAIAIQFIRDGIVGMIKV